MNKSYELLIESCKNTSYCDHCNGRGFYFPSGGPCKKCNLDDSEQTCMTAKRYEHNCPKNDVCPTCQNIEMEFDEWKNNCNCASRLGGGDCMHTVNPEDLYPSDEEMLAEGWKRDEDGCWRMPNKHIKTTIDHDDDCAKWAPHCDCKKIYVDEWVGWVPECEMNDGMCFGVKLDASIKCTCLGPRTEHWERDNGTKFDLYKRWYPSSGSIYCCSSCGVEDHIGDINWEFHKCTPKPTFSYSTDEDEIPF